MLFILRVCVFLRCSLTSNAQNNRPGNICEFDMCEHTLKMEIWTLWPMVVGWKQVRLWRNPYARIVNKVLGFIWVIRISTLLYSPLITALSGLWERFPHRSNIIYRDEGNRYCAINVRWRIKSLSVHSTVDTPWPVIRWANTNLVGFWVKSEWC